LLKLEKEKIDTYFKLRNDLILQGTLLLYELLSRSVLSDYKNLRIIFDEIFYGEDKVVDKNGLTGLRGNKSDRHLFHKFIDLWDQATVGYEQLELESCKEYLGDEWHEYYIDFRSYLDDVELEIAKLKDEVPPFDHSMWSSLSLMDENFRRLGGSAVPVSGLLTSEIPHYVLTRFIKIHKLPLVDLIEARSSFVEAIPENCKLIVDRHLMAIDEIEPYKFLQKYFNYADKKLKESEKSDAWVQLGKRLYKI